MYSSHAFFLELDGVGHQSAFKGSIVHFDERVTDMEDPVVMTGRTVFHYNLRRCGLCHEEQTGDERISDDVC